MRIHPTRFVIIVAIMLILSASTWQHRPSNVPQAELIWSADYGGSGFDTIFDVAVSPDGLIVVVGSTGSEDFPVVNAAQPDFRGGLGVPRDGFVAKIDPADGGIVWATYLGGSSIDQISGVTVDESGNVYVVGDTRSDDFPVQNPLQSNLSGSQDAVVAGYDPEGRLLFSTYFGGSNVDIGFDITLGPEGDVWIVGQSQDVPAVNPLQGPGGSIDAFVATLDSSGQTVLFASPLGGAGIDGAGAVVSSPEAILISGQSESDDFPSVGGLGEFTGESLDAFVTKLRWTDREIIYSTRFGGNGPDEVQAVDIDSQGRAYVAGRTFSDDFPTQNPTQSSLAGEGGNDAFLTVLNSAGDELLFSTYLGGVEADPATDVNVLGDSLASVTGSTFSSDFPDDVDPLVPPQDVTPRSFVTTYGGVTSGNPSVLFSSTIPGAERINAVASYSGGVVALGGFSRTGVSGSARSKSQGDNGFAGLLRIAELLAQPSDLSVTKTLITDVPDGELSIGDSLRYRIMVRNSGGPATDVEVVDQFGDSNLESSDNARLLENTPGASSISDSSLGWIIPDLEPGGERTFTVVLTPTKSGVPLLNRVSVEHESQSVEDEVGILPRPSLADFVIQVFVGATPAKRAEAIDVYLDGFLVADDLEFDAGFRSADSIRSLEPLVEITDATSPDNSAPISSTRVEWFTESDSLFAFSEQTVLLITSAGDSLLPLVRQHARFEADDTDMVDVTIAQAAEEAGGVDVRVSGSISNSADGLEFGHFTDYWSGAPGLTDVTLTQTSDATTLGTWRFDLSDRAGEAVTLVVEPASRQSGKAADVNMAGFDAQGRRFEAVAVSASDLELPDGSAIEIEPNWPNPLDGRTTFSVAVSKPAQVRIDVFDAIGRLVDHVEARVSGPEPQEIELDARDLSPGTYFYRIQSGGLSKWGKMVVVR